MKKLLVFILILASKGALACGFYPEGEEIRFSFLDPNIFGYYSFKTFNYSSASFYPEAVYSDFDEQPNEKLWIAYCKNKVSYKAVSEAINVLSEDEIMASSNNEMIKYLFKTKDTEAIDYLKFAKSCEFFNSWMEDPWERNESMSSPIRTRLINRAVLFSQKSKKEQFRYRYAFQAIRLAFYDGNKKKIKAVYADVFENKKSKDILYYWSLYFRALSEDDKALCNFYASQVFTNAPDKRFQVAQQYNTEVPIAQTLQYAKTDKERANVYLLDGIETPDKRLANMKKVYEYNPKFDGLSFLLLREVNKMEDWIFTPYYSLFEPSLDNTFWDSDDNSKNSVANVLKRVETDRAYAGEVLQFINSVDLKTIDNPTVWKTCKAYILYMTKDYNACLDMVNQLDQKDTPEEMKKQLEILRTLALNANQEYGKAIILDEIKPIILKNKGNAKFVFALGRELEYNGNTTDAALLYSAMKPTDDYGSPYWKSSSGRGDTYSDYYDDYFSYLNVKYTPQQVEALIQNVIRNRDKEDNFSVYKYTTLKTQIQNLYDLEGTKYIRQNRLSKALANFKKVDSKLWNDKYSDWERNDDGSDWNYGSNTFDANPFYELKYTPAFIPIKDTIRLNKYTVTRQLIRYINKAENVNEKNRDYYYFLVGNCYFNMTHFGNCWMMRRYYWTADGEPSFLEDEAEYNECNSAKFYYLLALKHAKTDKFKALCLRMIGRCEKNRLNYSDDRGYDSENYDSYLFANNKYYMDLQKKYPNYFDQLTSDCTYFEDYFKARR